MNDEKEKDFLVILQYLGISVYRLKTVVHGMICVVWKKRLVVIFIVSIFEETNAIKSIWNR